MAMTAEKQTVFDWIDQHRAELSEQHLLVWNFAEPAWREYRSAAFFVDLLRKAGFEVEAGSATMPTAFCATFGRGKPVLGAYAEYDAVPGMSQAPVTYRKPRDGFHRSAAGHTDPHSALGMGALAGVLGAKAAMERHRPARHHQVLRRAGREGVRLEARARRPRLLRRPRRRASAFIPRRCPALANSTVWDTHCGAYWSKIYTFECPEPQTWGSAGSREGTNNSHTTARAPAALDAVCLMYTTTKYTKEAMLPHRGTWTLNEFILVAGQATSDNLAPTFSQIQYSWRCPSLEMAERILDVLEQNARHVAAITHCQVSSDWVTRTRVGLPNHAMAEITYREPRAGGAALVRRGGEEVRAGDPEDARPGPDGRPVHARDLRADTALDRRGAASPVAPALADELHLRRLRRVHVARADLAPVHRPRDAAGRRGPTTAIPTGRAMPSAASRPPSIRCGTRPGAPSAPRWSN